MSQKPDYYAILGVEKTASEADIKKAFMRITMTCHPDGAPYKKLDDAEKAQADEKFKYGKEAQTILLDPVKRTAYDKFGHAGLDSMKGQSGGQEQGANTTGTPRPVRTRSNEEVFDYFDRAAQRNGDAPKTSTATTSAGAEQSEEEMRRAAAEARRRNRGQNSDSGTFAPPPAPREEPKPAPVVTEKPAQKPTTASSPVSAIFDSVASKMSDAADRLRTAAKTDAPVSVDALEKFRDSLSDLIGEVDDAIRTARRNPPRGGYNR